MNMLTRMPFARSVSTAHSVWKPSLSIAAIWLAALTSPLSISAQVAASNPPVQSLDRIGQAAELAVRQILPDMQAETGDVLIRARALDPRLRLPACSTGPLAELPARRGSAGRLLVAVRCRGPATWTIYVAVEVQSTVKVLRLRRGAHPGESLEISDVAESIAVLPGISVDYVNTLSQIRGQSLRRARVAGDLLMRADFRPDPVVKRGDRVTIVASAAGIEVRAAALAIADAASDGRVRVRNETSLKIVEGRVDNAGVVRLGN